MRNYYLSLNKGLIMVLKGFKSVLNGILNGTRIVLEWLLFGRCVLTRVYTISHQMRVNA